MAWQASFYSSSHGTDVLIYIINVQHFGIVITIVFCDVQPEETATIDDGVDIASLRHPQRDADRVQKPDWLVVLGICTHLGCVVYKLG